MMETLASESQWASLTEKVRECLDEYARGVGIVCPEIDSNRIIYDEYSGMMHYSIKYTDFAQIEFGSFTDCMSRLKQDQRVTKVSTSYDTTSSTILVRVEVVKQKTSKDEGRVVVQDSVARAQQRAAAAFEPPPRKNHKRRCGCCCRLLMGTLMVSMLIFAALTVSYSY